MRRRCWRHSRCAQLRAGARVQPGCCRSDGLGRSARMLRVSEAGEPTPGSYVGHLLLACPMRPPHGRMRRPALQSGEVEALLLPRTFVEHAAAADCSLAVIDDSLESPFNRFDQVQPRRSHRARRVPRLRLRC